MTPEKLRSGFDVFLRANRISLDGAPVERGVDAMIRFYAEVRAKGCDLAADGDMLPCQWGTWSWGNGKHFEFDITRQVIFPDEEDDDAAIWQLHLTYQFPPEEALSRLASWNEWCHTPEDLPDFESAVRKMTGFNAVGHRTDGAI